MHTSESRESGRKIYQAAARAPNGTDPAPPGPNFGSGPVARFSAPGQSHYDKLARDLDASLIYTSKSRTNPEVSPTSEA